MLVICLPFKAWKNNARLPKYLKRISYSMCNIYLMVWQQEILKKLLNQKNWIKRRQNEIQPLSYWTFVSGLHKEMGSEILAVHFCTKVAVFWTHTSKMVTTSFNAYVRVIILHLFSSRQEIQHHKIVSSQPYKVSGEIFLLDIQLYWGRELYKK